MGGEKSIARSQVCTVTEHLAVKLASKPRKNKCFVLRKSAYSC